MPLGFLLIAIDSCQYLEGFRVSYSGEPVKKVRLSQFKPWETCEHWTSQLVLSTTKIQLPALWVPWPTSLLMCTPGKHEGFQGEGGAHLILGSRQPAPSSHWLDIVLAGHRSIMRRSGDQVSNTVTIREMGLRFLSQPICLACHFPMVRTQVLNPLD